MCHRFEWELPRCLRVFQPTLTNSRYTPGRRGDTEANVEWRCKSALLCWFCVGCSYSYADTDDLPSFLPPFEACVMAFLCLMKYGFWHHWNVLRTSCLLFPFRMIEFHVFHYATMNGRDRRSWVFFDIHVLRRGSQSGVLIECFERMPSSSAKNSTSRSMAVLRRELALFCCGLGGIYAN